MATRIVQQTEPMITGEELAAWSDLGPCELVAGSIAPVTPTSDEHGGYEANIVNILLSFVRTHGLGKVRSGEVGVYTRRNPDTIRAVDVLFISNERYDRKGATAFLEIPPDLIVEILSPGNTWAETIQKLREFFAIGVRLVWLVDPSSQSVFAYRSLTDVREFPIDDHLPGDDALPGFSIEVREIFAD
jgi:Uma2 family endonuclease